MKKKMVLLNIGFVFCPPKKTKGRNNICPSEKKSKRRSEMEDETVLNKMFEQANNAPQSEKELREKEKCLKKLLKENKKIKKEERQQINEELNDVRKQQNNIEENKKREAARKEHNETLAIKRLEAQEILLNEKVICICFLNLIFKLYDIKSDAFDESDKNYLKRLKIQHRLPDLTEEKISACFRPDGCWQSVLRSWLYGEYNQLIESNVIAKRFFDFTKKAREKMLKEKSQKDNFLSFLKRNLKDRYDIHIDINSIASSSEHIVHEENLPNMTENLPIDIDIDIDSIASSSEHIARDRESSNHVQSLNLQLA